MAFRSFEDLDVWKRGCGLAVYVYECLAANRDFGIRDQMQRSAFQSPQTLLRVTKDRRKTLPDFLRSPKGHQQNFVLKFVSPPKLALSRLNK